MVNLANVLSAERKARIEQDDKTVCLQWMYVIIQQNLRNGLP